MRIVGLLVTALALASTGCLGSRPSGSASTFELFWYNAGTASVRAIDCCVFTCKATRQARAAWREVVRSCPKRTFSDYYEEGFIDGYVDYLDAGGIGEPPAVPPFCYRTTHYHTPAGLEAINDWFAGFRHGAAEARASGLRELIVVPVSSVPAVLFTPPGESYSPETTGPPRAVSPPTPGAEPLPPPRPLAPPPIIGLPVLPGPRPPLDRPAP